MTTTVPAIAPPAAPTPRPFRLLAPRLVVLALTAGGLVLRLHHLVGDGRDIWLDEAFSIWLAHQPLPEIVRTMAAVDKHPPLFQLLLHYWLLVGDDPWWARLFGVLAGVLTIPLLAQLGFASGRRWLGVAAAALTACSPVLIRYAQEVRMYALLVLLAALSSLLLVRAVASARRWPWVAFGLATLALLYTHNAGWFVLPAQALFVLLTKVSPRARRRYLGSMALVGLGYLPWLPALRHQSAALLQHWNNTPATAADVQQVFLSLAGLWPLVTPAPLWLALGVGLLLLAGAWLAPRPPAVLALALAAGSFTLPLLLGVVRPLFGENVVLAATVGVLLLLAALVAAVRPLVPRLLLLGLLLGVDLASLETGWQTLQNEQWQEVAGYLAVHARPADLVLFNAAWTQFPFDYYYNRIGMLPLTEHGLPVDRFGRGQLEPLVGPADLPRIAELTAGRSHVWLVLSHDWYTDPQHLLRPAMRRLFPQETAYWYRGIVLLFYQR